MKKLMFFLVFLLSISFVLATDFTIDNQHYYSSDNDTTSGTIAIDSANNKNGTLTGGVTTGVSGIIKDSYQYDGVNEFNIITPTTTFNDGTFATWFKIQDNTVATQTIVQGFGGSTWFCQYRASTTDVLCNTFGGSGDTPNEIALNTWYHLAVVDYGSYQLVYINGTQELNLTGNPSLLNTELKTGCNHATTSCLKGWTDETGFWNTTFTSSKIQELYNNGVGLNPYAPTPNITGNFDIIANDFWDNSSLTSFNATVNGTLYQTTNGTINTNIPSNSSSLFNITISKTGWFSRDYLNYNVSVDLNSQIKNSEINIKVYKEFDNTLVSDYNITLDGQTFNVPGNNLTIFPTAKAYTVTSVVDNTGVEVYSLVDDTFTANNLDNKSVNITVVGHTINIKAIDSINSNTINIFNTTLIGLNFTDNRSNYTTNGVSTFKVNDGWFNITVDAPGYALQNNSIILKVNNTKEEWNYTFSLLRTNSINFTFHDEDLPLSLFPYNVTFELFSSVGATNYSTTNGFRFLENLTADDYEIRYTSDGWDIRSYFFTIDDRSADNIKLYLSNSTETTSYIIRVADLSDSDVPSAIVRLQRQYVEFNGQYVTIEEGRTDTDGETDFFIQESSGINYRFIVLIDDEIVKTTEPQNIINIAGISLKRITIRVDIGTSIYSSYDDIQGLFTSLTNNSDIWNYEFIDGKNQISNGCLRVLRQAFGSVSNNVVSNQCFGATSGNLTVNITPLIVNNTVLTIQGLVNYNTGLEVVRESKQLTYQNKGNNADDSDDVLLTAFFYLIVNLAIILIPSIIIQIFLGGLGLYFLSWIGFNNLGTLMAVMIMVINLIINWSRKNTKDGEPR